MALNIGYLTSSNAPENQEMYTPYYAVEPLLKYVPKDKRIWLPFDKEWSAFYQLFKQGGYDVVKSHIDDGQDYFEYEPDEWDIMVSNPPFSIKDRILERANELGKPFALLLPLDSLQGRKRYEVFKDGIQLLSFDNRIGYHRTYSMDKTVESTPFASAYFCRNLLPRDLIIEHLEKYERSL